MTVEEVFKAETTSPDFSNLVLILLSLAALGNKQNKTKQNKGKSLASPENVMIIFKKNF